MISTSSSTSHGTHDSMPSKWAPSARRSHCSRPHGSVATRRGGALAHLVARRELAGREDHRLGEVGDRALVVDAERGEPVDLVAPQVDADRRVGGGREHVDDRAAPGELAAVLDELLAPVAERDELRRRARRGRRSRSAARRSARRRRRPGRASAAARARRRRSPAGSARASRSRHSTSSRWPIVSTFGLTRSNGSVSHAGNSATWSAPRNCWRSSASWPAIVPVGQATTSGRRCDRCGERGDRDRPCRPRRSRGGRRARRAPA